MSDFFSPLVHFRCTPHSNFILRALLFLAHSSCCTTYIRIVSTRTWTNTPKTHSMRAISYIAFRSHYPIIISIEYYNIAIYINLIAYKLFHFCIAVCGMWWYLCVRVRMSWPFLSIVCDDKNLFARAHCIPTVSRMMEMSTHYDIPHRVLIAY